MQYVYILQSLKDGDLYIGCTNDLKRRFEEHNLGNNFATKSRVPFRLVYYEAYISDEEAFVKEKFYKSGRGHEVIHKFLFKTLDKTSIAKIAKVVTAGA